MAAPTTQKIPQDRLNQIASRKLSALGIPFGVREGEPLRGTVSFGPGRLLNPISNLPIAQSAFVLVSHDQMQFTDPPLRELPPIQFYDAAGMPQLEQRVTLALKERADRLGQVAARFKALRLQTSLQPETLRVRGLLNTGGTVFEFEGRPDGVYLTRFAEGGGAPRALGEQPFDLSPFDAPIDLELHLEDTLPALREAADQAPRQAERAAAAAAASAADELTLQPAPVPGGSWALGLLSEHFGPDAFVTPGERLTIAQEFQLGDQRLRFQAVHEVGNRFHARVMGPKGTLLEQRIDLEKFAGAPQMVAAVVGAKVQAAARTGSVSRALGASELSAAPSITGRAGDVRQPRPSEIWSMSVIVEDEDPAEIRYVCADVDRRPYGATRILKRADFEQLFVQGPAGWELRIVIERVTPEAVFYRHLDGQRRPVGNLRSLAPAVLLSNFMPG